MKRLYRYDVLRVVACAAVIIYHFESDAIKIGAVPSTHHQLVGWTRTFLGVGLGNLAVFMFFLLAGLMRSKELNLEHLNVREFYHKRFKRLFIPFYLSYFLVLIYRILSGRTQFAVPGSRIVLTMLGLDVYPATLSPSLPFATFGLVGEWFFGAFVVVTLTWPLVHALWRRCPPPVC